MREWRSGAEEKKNKRRARGRTNLSGSRGTQHNGVFRADKHFVLDAHSEAVEMLGELRIGRDVDAGVDGDERPFLQSSISTAQRR